MSFFLNQDITFYEQYFRELDLRSSKLADQIYSLLRACCGINTKSHFSARRSTLKHFGDCAFNHWGEYMGYTIVAKSSFTNVNITSFWLKERKSKSVQWEGGGTYAHPFPLQQTETGDFFGYESILFERGHLQRTSYYFQK